METDHPLPFDIYDSTQKREIDVLVTKWVTDDENAQTNYWAEWDECDDRLNGAATPKHECVLGDVISIRRKLALSGRNSTDRNRAEVLTKHQESIEDTELLPETLYFMAKDQCLGKGSSWPKFR